MDLITYFLIAGSSLLLFYGGMRIGHAKGYREAMARMAFVLDNRKEKAGK